MAKTIKFNLICDDKPIRTIEDLQNNFVIEDVLAYYDNKLLHRWLKVRGYTEELEKVEALTVKQPVEIIKALIQIFQVESDEKKVEESTYILNYQEERKELYSVYEKQNYNVKNIIEDYETGYRQIVEDILAHSDDAARIKADIVELVENYKGLLDLDYRELFYKLPYLAVMCSLMNETMRTYYLPIFTEDEEGFIQTDLDANPDKRAMYNQICKAIDTNQLEEQLGDNIISFAGVTDGYWKDLEPKGKKYMILSMGQGDYVRASGVSGGDLSQIDINNKFVIVDGIDYKSNSSMRRLLYMEV